MASVLDSLPTPDELTAKLGPILGSAADDRGLAGALSALGRVSVDDLRSTAAGALTSGAGFDMSALGTTADGLRDPLGALAGVVPAHPEDVVGPLAQRLGSLGGLVGDDLAGLLTRGAEGLETVRKALPAESSDLFAAASDGFGELGQALLTGAFAQLGAWSGGVAELAERAEQAAAGGAGDLHDRLLQLLTETVHALLALVLPDGTAPAQVLAARIGAALPAAAAVALAQSRTAAVDALDAAAAAFAAGDGAAALPAAQQAVGAVGTELQSVASALTAALRAPAATPGGLATELNARLDAFAQVEIVDLDDVRSRFHDAVAGLGETITRIDLPGAREKVEQALQSVAGAVEQLGLATLPQELARLQQQADDAVAALAGDFAQVTAGARSALRAVADGLRQGASAFGSFDPDGTFHFAALIALTEQLQAVHDLLTDQVTPAVKSVHDAVSGAISSARDGVQAAADAVAGVKTELQTAIQAVHDDLGKLDVPGRIAELKRQEGELLDGLGVDFEQAVAPVLDAIRGMRDDIAALDVDKLNPLLKAALAAAVEIMKVLEPQFEPSVEQPLLDQLDELLGAPRKALTDAQAAIEAQLTRFDAIAPEQLAKPVADLFGTLKAAILSLDPATLAQPLLEPYAALQRQIAGLSPATLLKPVVDAFDALKAAVGEVSPDALVELLHDRLDQLREIVASVDLSGTAGVLAAGIGELRTTLDRADPGPLLDPLVRAYDAVAGALDPYDPRILLAPLARAFAAVRGALDTLTDAHVAAVHDAFAPLVQVPDELDPARAYAAAASALAGVAGGLDALGAGAAIAAVRAAQQRLAQAAAAAGAPAGVRDAVAALDPVADATIAAAADALAQARTQAAAAFAVTEPPAALAARYLQARPRLQLLAPGWLTATVDAHALRDAVAAIDPSAYVEDLGTLFDAVKAQLQGLDPRPVQQALRGTFDLVRQVVAGLDPAALTTAVEALADRLADALAALDPAPLAIDLHAIAAEVDAVVAALDPRALVTALGEITTALGTAVAAADPQALLAELHQPLEALAALAGRLDPTVLLSGLGTLVDDIRALIDTIDVVDLLQPLLDRIDELRDALHHALDDVGDAIGAMVAAIPV